MNSLSGQVQGLEIGMQAVLDFGPQEDDLVRTLNEQTAAIGQCLKVCMAALSGTTKTSGNTIKYARAFDNARQLVGTIGKVTPGGPTNRIDVMIAQDRAQQMGGSIEGKVALDFMSAPA
jgi:hypothetical protein